MVSETVKSSKNNRCIKKSENKVKWWNDTVFSLGRDRMSVTVRPTDEKSLSDCTELAGMHRSLQAVSTLCDNSSRAYPRTAAGCWKQVAPSEN